MAYNRDTPTTPNTNNYRKITGDAYFTADNDTKSGDIALGNVTMVTLKHGNSEVEVMRSFKGGLQRADSSTSEVKPEWDLTLNEYTPNLVGIYLFGGPGPDLVQAAATATPLNLASVNVGRSYRFGKRMLVNVLVKVGAVTMVQDLDYNLDTDKGVLTVMDGGGIVDGSALTITFDNAAVTMKTVKPYTQLSRYGFLRIFGEDSKSGNPREEYYFRCNIVPTDPGAGDPKKYSEAKLKVMVLGAMSLNMR